MFNSFYCINKYLCKYLWLSGIFVIITNIRTYMYTNICTNMWCYTYLWTYLWTYFWKYLWIFTNICTNMCKHKYLHKYFHKYEHKYLHKYLTPQTFAQICAQIFAQILWLQIFVQICVHIFVHIFVIIHKHSHKYLHKCPSWSCLANHFEFQYDFIICTFVIAYIFWEKIYKLGSRLARQNFTITQIGQHFSIVLSCLCTQFTADHQDYCCKQYNLTLVLVPGWPRYVCE